MYDRLELKARVIAAGAAAEAAVMEAELAEMVSKVAMKVVRAKMAALKVAPLDSVAIQEADWAIDTARAALEALMIKREEACVAALAAAETAEAAAIATEEEMRRLSAEK